MACDFRNLIVSAIARRAQALPRARAAKQPRKAGRRKFRNKFSARKTTVRRVFVAQDPKTVVLTSQAAREVAAQIVVVSTEAVETSRRASEIRDGSSDIANKVDSLRSILVRVIRTSTSAGCSNAKR